MRGVEFFRARCYRKVISFRVTSCCSGQSLHPVTDSFVITRFIPYKKKMDYFITSIIFNSLNDTFRDTSKCVSPQIRCRSELPKLAGLLCFLLVCARETQRDPGVTTTETPGSHRCPQNAHPFVPIAERLTSPLQAHAMVLTDAWRITTGMMKIKDGVFLSRSSTQESEARWCSPTWRRGDALEEFAVRLQ